MTRSGGPPPDEYGDWVRGNAGTVGRPVTRWMWAFNQWLPFADWEPRPAAEPGSPREWERTPDGIRTSSYGRSITPDNGEESAIPRLMHASPQFWESAPTTEPNRVYFTAEGDGRVIAGGSGTGAMLSRDEVVSLAAWLARVSGMEDAP